MLRVVRSSVRACVRVLYTCARSEALCDLFATNFYSFVTLCNSQSTTRVVYTKGDSDVISIDIYASWFSPPSCG